MVVGKLILYQKDFGGVGGYGYFVFYLFACKFLNYTCWTSFLNLYVMQ